MLTGKPSILAKYARFTAFYCSGGIIAHNGKENAADAKNDKNNI